MNVVLSFCSVCPLVAYFLKKNYSLRQNILKILRVWERSLTSVPIGVYLDLIEVGTWLRTGSTKDFEDLLEKEWLDAAPDSEVQRSVSSQEVNLLRWSDRLCCSASGQIVVQRPIKRRRSRQWGPDSGCVRSRLQRFWTSLESTGL